MGVKSTNKVKVENPEYVETDETGKEIYNEKHNAYQYDLQ